MCWIVFTRQSSLGAPWWETLHLRRAIPSVIGRALSARFGGHVLDRLYSAVLVGCSMVGDPASPTSGFICDWQSAVCPVWWACAGSSLLGSPRWVLHGGRPCISDERFHL